jgi:GST-like protein
LGWVVRTLGHTHQFVFYHAGEVPYAEERYRKENARIYRVLDTRLGEQQYLAGDYSIADIATWPWISRYPRQEMNLHEYPNLLRWYLELAARPAVQRGYVVPEHVEDIPIPD